MTLLFTEYLLLLYVIAGLIVSMLLGAGIGGQGLFLALRQARRMARERDRAQGRAALAEAALTAATRPAQNSDALDDSTDALIRVLTDGSGRALPQSGADPDAWLWGERE